MLQPFSGQDAVEPAAVQSRQREGERGSRRGSKQVGSWRRVTLLSAGGGLWRKGGLRSW